MELKLGNTAKLKIKKGRIVTYKINKAEYCYKEFKFLRKEIIDGSCPWGYEKFDIEHCKHCRWFVEKNIKEEEIKEEIK